MRRISLIAAFGLVAQLAIGCGGTTDKTPVACLGGSAFYLGKGRDDVRISDCLAENQKGGDLAAVGTAMVSAATELNAEARADPGGAANLQLGYLLGAAQRRSDETGGIHAELIRRLATAARYNPGNRPLPPSFLRTYRRGYDAGHEIG